MKKWISILISLVLFAPSTLIAQAVEIATVQSVKVSPDSVRIRTDQPVNYNAFTTSVPPRLIIDLIDSRIKSPENFPGMGKLLKRVRTGQYRIKPMSIARIVLDLAQKATYDIISQGNEINVNLLANAIATDLKDAPSISPATASKPQTVIIAKKTLPVIPTKKRKKIRKSKIRDIMNSLPKDLVSIDYDLADIRDVLGWCAAKIGINIICDDVVGQITLRLNKVPFNEAFRTILNLNGLATEQVGNNILRVATPAVLRATRLQAMKVTKIFTLNYAQATELQGKITSIAAAEGSQAVCTADSVNNMLIVTETPSGLESIARLIKQLDRKPQQVLIETKFVEVALSEGLDLGINWSMYTTDRSKIAGQDGLNFFGMANADASYGNDIPIPLSAGTGGTGVYLPASTMYGAFRLGRITSNYVFDTILSAAAKKTKVKVLSDPKVATLNNKEATIDITTQIPYETSTCTQADPPSCTTLVTYLTVGIILRVTPTINADGRVTLKIHPEVSQPSVTLAATSGGAPAIDSRSADTTVMVRDGETIVIGGLIHDTISKGVFKIPLFGDIPLIGWLFKKKTTSRDRMELLIFVTPRILEG